MADTLARLLRHTVSYDKPDTILTKQEGRYQPISARELYRRVAALHLELRNASIRKGDRWHMKEVVSEIESDEVALSLMKQYLHLLSPGSSPIVAEFEHVGIQGK
jgi:hypothetical protein